MAVDDRRVGAAAYLRNAEVRTLYLSTLPPLLIYLFASVKDFSRTPGFCQNQKLLK
jgi:hypothetical protein